MIMSLILCKTDEKEELFTNSEGRAKVSCKMGRHYKKKTSDN